MVQKKDNPALKVISLITLGLVSSVALADDGCTNSSGVVDPTCKLEAKLVQAGDDKLRAAFNKANGTVYSSDYTLKPGSLSYPGNNFASTTMKFNDYTQINNPIGAASNSVGICDVNSPTTVTQGAGLTVTNGETFTSSSSLTTDTTVKVSTSYASVSLEATTEITTNDATTSSATSQTVTSSTTGTSKTYTLACGTDSQPKFAYASATINQSLYVTTPNDPNNPNQDIPYTYNLFPIDSAGYFQNAAFTATLQKASTITPGSGVIYLSLYNNNKNRVAYYIKQSTATPTCRSYNTCNGTMTYNANDNTFNLMYPTTKDVLVNWQKKKHKVYYYSVNWGGVNPNDAKIIFKNQDGVNDYTVPSTITQNQLYSVPIGAEKILGWELKNWQANGSDAGEVTLSNVKVSDMLNQDEASYEVSGIYNAASMANLSMDTAFLTATWDQVKKGKFLNADETLAGCPAYANYTNVEDVKKAWRKANKCGNQPTKSVSTGTVGATADGSDKKTRRSLKADKDGKVAGRRATAETADTERRQQKKSLRRAKLDTWTLTDSKGNIINSIGLKAQKTRRSN
jgi:hypothetical protein